MKFANMVPSKRQQLARLQSVRQQLGQGMTEYIIIVALISVAAIGVYSAFGQTIRNQTAGLAKEISGQNASTEITASQTSATKAATRGKADKGLGNYNADNDQKAAGQ